MHEIGRNCFQIKAQADSKEAEIMVYGDIGESWFGESVEATKFVKDLAEVDAEVITARINSYGGSVTDGIAIYNALKRHKATVNVEIDGIAASIASMIAMAGDYVGMADNARIMIHAPWTYTVSNAEGHREAAERLDGWAESMAAAYTRGGMAHDEVLAILKGDKDVWYSAEEAKEAGLVDNVTEAMAVAAKYQENRFTVTPPKAEVTPPAATVAAHTEEEPKMADDKATATDTQSQDNVVKIEKAGADKARAEILARNNQLRTIRGMSTDEGVIAVIDECIADPAITMDQAMQRIEAKLGEGSAPVTSPATIDAGVDVRDKFRAGVSAALLARMGVGEDDRRNEFRGKSLAEICGQSLVLAGHNVHGLTKSEIADKVLAAGHSSSDFPNLLSNSGNKTLVQAYSDWPSTWQLFSDRSEVSDFKVNTRIRLGSFNSLLEIKEGDEYKQGTIQEEKETIQALTKGRYLELSRHMIVNDDLNGFSRAARLLGQAAARTLESDVYAVINANAAMDDGTELFHADHANLAASGGAPTVTTVGAARTAMRKQQFGDDYLNIFPAYFLVPVELEDTANVLMASSTDPAQANSRKPNSVRNMAEVISSPYLSATSTTAWYLLASQNVAPVVDVAFLDGNSTPYVAQEEEFLTDAIRWKVRMDYGVDTNDYRGGYKNAGA